MFSTVCTQCNVRSMGARELQGLVRSALSRACSCAVRMRPAAQPPLQQLRGPSYNWETHCSGSGSLLGQHTTCGWAILHDRPHILTQRFGPFGSGYPELSGQLYALCSFAAWLPVADSPLHFAVLHPTSPSRGSPMGNTSSSVSAPAWLCISPFNLQRSAKLDPEEVFLEKCRALALAEMAHEVKAQAPLTEKTVFHVIAKRGFSHDVVSELARASTSELINTPDRAGRSPLHVACQWGHAGIVMSYIAFGVDIYSTDKEKDTPLHYAARYGHVECAALLLAAGRVLEAEEASRASSRTPGSRFKYLVNMQNACGFTALHYAALAGHLEVVQLLLCEGASLCLHNHKQSSSSWLRNVPVRSNPLHVAASGGHVYIAKAIVQAFLDRPTDIRQPDPRLLRDILGQQPYMVAGNSGHWFCAQLLLLVSRDETHAYWERYMQLSQPQGVSTVQIDSMARIAHTTWLGYLDQQLASIAEQVDSIATRTALDVPPRCSDQVHRQPAVLSRTPSDAGAASKVHSFSGAAQHALHERGLSDAGDDARLCGVCFERPALVSMTSCTHAMCASCSKRVVAMETNRVKSAPKCPFCQQHIGGFALKPC